MNKLVSVIITSYNRPSFLIEAIQSIYRQTSINIIKIAVYDDKSPGKKIKTILEGYSQKHNNFSYWISPTHVGFPAYLLNKGYGLSTGKYIVFLNDDDSKEKTFVEELLNQFDSNTDVVYCRSRSLDGKASINIVEKPTAFDYRLLLDRNYISINEVMIRKKALDLLVLHSRATKRLSIPYEIKLKTEEEYLLFLLLARRGCKFKYYPKPLSIIRSHKGNKSSRPERAQWIQGAKKIREEYGFR